MAGTLLLFAGGVVLPAQQAAAPPVPGPRDLCPVCGMLVAKYPNWLATVVWKDRPASHFDGPKDMFKYLLAPGRGGAGAASIHVTEFYGLTRIRAETAWYVAGSDVLGPMGHELVPLASREDAEDFMKDHKGRLLLRFAQVTPQILASLDSGRF